MTKCSSLFLVAGVSAAFVAFAATAIVQNNSAKPAKGSLDSKTMSPLQSPQSALNLFTRGVYWPWPRTAWAAQNAKMDEWQFSDKIMGELKNRYHIDLIWVVNISSKDAVRLTGIAEKYGIAVLPSNIAMYNDRNVRTLAAAEKIAEKIVGDFGDEKGISGYVLLDEPLADEMNQLENVRAALAKIDPSRPAFVVSTPRQLEAEAKQAKFPFLVTDAYPFFSANNPNGPNTPTQSRDYYILVSQRIAALSRKTAKIPWMMPMVFGNVRGDWHYDKNMNVVVEPGASQNLRMPTPDETKWEIWQAIAAGAKGTVFYVLFPSPNPRRSAQDPKDMKGYSPMKLIPGMPVKSQDEPLGVGDALFYNDGSPTPQIQAMGDVFSALEPQRKLLGRLQTAPPVAFANAPLRVSTFRDPATCHTIVVVVNDNTESSTTGKIRLLPTLASAQDLISGSTINAENNPTTKLSTLPLTIGAGEGALLDLGNVDASLTYSEDFSVQLSAGKLDNVVKVLSPVDWGLGYYVDAQTQPGASSPGQLQYKLSQVAGDWKRMGGRLYLIYDGSGNTASKNIQLSVSSDGQNFQPLSTDEFNQPVAIPKTTTDLRFTLLNKDVLFRGWQLISVP